jgi:hypothetical protein
MSYCRHSTNMFNSDHIFKKTIIQKIVRNNRGQLNSLNKLLLLQIESNEKSQKRSKPDLNSFQSNLSVYQKLKVWLELALLLCQIMLRNMFLLAQHFFQ